MTIEIDDSGTGDLIGDAFIGFHRVETGEICFRSVHVGLFNEENWKQKEPFNKAVELVKQGLKQLNFDKEKDKILICRGNFFDKVREYFENQDIKYESTVIDGKLQDAVEGRLVKHLRKLGVNSKRLTKKSGATRYFVLFNWVCRDFYNRERYVKTGFPAWKKKWRERAIKKFEKRYKS
ncbi:MAG: hypothetical protein BAJALOKI2v1_520005 [Promethearchaeota archaeon]|nr:MAG: hypothetical protein BAJALOKI2v1_520005 [Candidatus Lokiarchaeota archaeon]